MDGQMSFVQPNAGLKDNNNALINVYIVDSFDTVA
jgi:hypothetical protein